MKKNLKATVLLGLLAGTTVIYAENTAPKVVVGIVVDQLRTDYLEQLRTHFGDKGFNRLIKDGVYLQDVNFRNTVNDAPSGAAVVYTGAWPVVNGVAGKEYFDPSTLRSVPTLTDESKSVYTPANLKVSTIADEFFITNGNLTKIYSITGDPQTGIVTAGHAGNSAVWLDDNTGKWTTSNYYGPLPPIFANKNRVAPLSSKIGSTAWSPLHSKDYYSGSATWHNADFRYTFAGSNKDTFSRYKSTPLFNAEVTEAAIDNLKSMQSGFLSLEYSLAPLSFDYDGDNRPELIDSYVRLDNEIGRLLDSIDKEFGEGNSVVFLASTGYSHEPEIPEEAAKIPTGEITLRQVESLLNSFLSATHGNSDYVTLIKDGRIYLNKKEIERKGINLQDIRKEVKEFLLRMSGVRDAVAIDEILRSDSPKAKDIGLGVDVKNAADIFIFFAPGWTVTDDNAYPATTEKVRLASPATPAFILAPDLLPITINTPVEATALAPTIASVIKIRGPNAAGDRPLTLERKTHNIKK